MAVAVVWGKFRKAVACVRSKPLQAVVDAAVGVGVGVQRQVPPVACEQGHILGLPGAVEVKRKTQVWQLGGRPFDVNDQRVDHDSITQVQAEDLGDRDG